MAKEKQGDSSFNRKQIMRFCSPRQLPAQMLPMPVLGSLIYRPSFYYKNIPGSYFKSLYIFLSSPVLFWPPLTAILFELF